jgi:pyridoxal phosphate enzyme (YggS family)
MWAGDPLPLPFTGGRLPAVNDRKLKDRTEVVYARIASAAVRAGRDPAAIKVLPITKGHPPAVVRAVALAGFEAVGENRVGEAELKQVDTGRLGLRWHMVGHLQRNKASRAVQLFDVIESVDSVRLGRRLEQSAELLGAGALRVLVQVNASGESRKSGFHPDAAVEAVGELDELTGIEVTGLMSMAPFTAEERVLRHAFRVTREALERCRGELAGFDGRELSMGMSNDFEIAVEEGSTEVRLGTVLLGDRPGA